ncbi:hypothetical protein QYF36_023596 [Acer negundo]|nr:hypothetical protein QYF36_023596 [Acer negundo]
MITIKIHIKNLCLIGKPLIGNSMMKRDARKTCGVKSQEPCIRSWVIIRENGDPSPELLSCRTPSGGFTTTWYVMVAINDATTIKAMFSHEHFQNLRLWLTSKQLRNLPIFSSFLLDCMERSKAVKPYSLTSFTFVAVSVLNVVNAYSY